MIGMFFANVFNPEVVHDEAENDGSPLAAPGLGGGVGAVL